LNDFTDVVAQQLLLQPARTPPGVADLEQCLDLPWPQAAVPTA
jgi:hypothetical protein